MIAIHRYPRTHHLEGSRLQPGDHDLDQVPLDELRGRYVVVEEKLDGANAGMFVDGDGKLRLQSRGHVLAGGAREKHFDLFKRWAHAHSAALADLLAGGLTLYGEWLYAKHTIFYDALPHYFLEFDVLDRETGDFLSTRARRELLQGVPVRSVPVIAEGKLRDPAALVRPSLYKSERWREALHDAARSEGLAVDRVVEQTDPHDLAEGLYIKAEDDTRVVGRFKFVRASFLTSVIDSGGHWIDRPIVPNRLAPGVDIFAEEPPT